jgi:hypothetical protein
MSTWKADMDVRSGLQEWEMAQNRAQCSVLVPAVLQLQVTVTVLVAWVLRIYASLRAKSDSYLRHVCPSTLITPTAIKISCTSYFVFLLKYADTIPFSVKFGQK